MVTVEYMIFVISSSKPVNFISGSVELIMLAFQF